MDDALTDFTEASGLVESLRPKLKRVRKPAKRSKVRKVAKKAAKRAKPKPARKAAVTLRPERLDLRLTKAEKSKLTKKAAETRRTVTSIILELIEKMR